MPNGDGSATSIGQEDQRRDREMLREERKHDSLKGDAEPATRDGWPAAGTPPSLPDPGETEDAWHPGDPDQPDRETSDGLAGSGPAQPDP